MSARFRTALVMMMIPCGCGPSFGCRGRWRLPGHGCEMGRYGYGDHVTDASWHGAARARMSTSFHLLTYLTVP